MELVVARTRKERTALKYGETFLKLFGLTVDDLVDFRKILLENRTLIATNTALVKENKVLKGEINDVDGDKEQATDLTEYLSKK